MGNNVTTDTKNSGAGLIMRSASITLAGTVFQLVISFLSGLIVARVIGSSAFGIFNIARTLCETLIVFTKMGFDIGIVRHFGEHPPGQYAPRNARFLARVLMTVLGLSLIPVAAILLGGGAWLEQHVYQYPDFGLVIAVMIITVPLMALTQVLGGAFRGYLRIRPRVIAEFFLQPSARLAVILLLFLAGWRLWSVITGTVLSFAVAVLYLLFHARRTFFNRQQDTGKPDNQDEKWRDFVTVGKYSIVISLTVSVAVLLQKLDVMMLGYFATASDVGKYAVIQMVVSLISIFNSALNQAVAPMLARFCKEGAIEDMRHLIHQHTRWVALTSLPVFLVIGFFGNQLMPIFGKDFHVGLAVVALLALSQFVLAVLSTAGFMLSMTGRHMLEFYTMLVALVCNAILNFFLIPAYGITGAAVGTLIAVVIANVLRSLQVYRIHGVFPVGGEVLRVVLVGVGVFAVIVLAARASGVGQGVAAAVVQSLLFCVVYAVLMLRFGLVEEDRILLHRAIEKYRLSKGGAI